MISLVNHLPQLNGNSLKTDQEFMLSALRLAQKAEENGEVPIGAVLVYNDQIIGEGWNTPISEKDPTAHAEIKAIRDAANTINNYRLVNTTLYVTLEPCMMCVGSIIHARINRLVFGAFDRKTGAVTTVENLINSQLHNHKVEWQGGILEKESSNLLKEFFKQRR